MKKTFIVLMLFCICALFTACNKNRICFICTFRDAYGNIVSESPPLCQQSNETKKSFDSYIASLKCNGYQCVPTHSDDCGCGWQ